MTNKEKAKNYAQNHFNREGLITRVALVRHFEKLLDWKEQQMIEKVVEWINIHMLYNASESYKKETIENFKKYMED